MASDGRDITEGARRYAARLPRHVQEPFRTVVAEAAGAWSEELGGDLVALVLFGSVARGEARSGSDVDVLLVARGFPRSLAERRRPLLARWEEHRCRLGLPAVGWGLVTKSPEEAAYHSPLYLDMVEDGILVHDEEGLMAGVLAAMRRRMRRLGSRRVHLDDGSWYWDLKPDYRPGEVVEI